ncbi:MAG: mersacidin/lichenicidin family type 2 lantibiotic [Pyrinomonadaceae bacterium]
MSQSEIIRAWKDAKFRRRLSEAERAMLPPNPAGVLEVSDEQIKEASGLAGSIALTTAMTCTEFTFRGWRQCCP